MTVSWKKGYNPERLVTEIESVRNLDENGKVTFRGWGFRELPVIMYSMLNFSSEVPETEARRIVHQAIFHAGETGSITPKSLLREINKLDNDFSKLHTQRFVLSTSLSIRNNDNLRNIRFDNSILIFEKSYLTKFQIKSKALIEQAEHSLFAELPKNYLPIRVHVSAKSLFGASNKALEFLDLIRGIWNFYLNRRHISRLSIGKAKPVNTIISGPIHTIHFPNGNLASNETWWYETSYIGSVDLVDLNRDIANLYKFLKRIRTQLSKCGYSDVLTESIIRYTRALDERNWNYAFLRLWSVLELLTNSTKENYTVTIKRASYVFAERDFHTQVLNHLREYRNSSVHFDKDTSEMETYLYQIKYYVETLLGFLIANKFGFQSMEDVTAFLSLPSSDDALVFRAGIFGREMRGSG